MRNRKHPRSLYEMAVSAYMASYVRAGTTTEKPNMQLVQLWKSVPSLLVDTLVSQGTAEFIKLYVDNRMERTPNALSFITIIVSPNMTVLDLSGLVCVPNHTCPGFVSLLNKSFCKLQNLQEICLKRHKREDTLPVCSDSTMRQIGKYCQNLKRLDVSNNGITSVGIKYLKSCSLLEQLFLYGCIKVTVGDLKFLLTNLRELHMLGHYKLSSALRQLYTDNSDEHLKLTHVTVTRESSDITWMLHSMCPELRNLRIDINGHDVEMNYFPHLTSLELRFSTRPSIVGLKHVFTLHKDQLTSIAISCSTLPIHDVVPILVINCSNIEKLWLKCLNIESVDITHIGTLRFECLSSLYLHVESEYAFAFDSPVCFIHSMLAHTQALKFVRLCVNTILIDAAWIDTFLKKVNTESLTSFLLCSPGGRNKFFLSMHSVHTILELCPQLTKLGNLKDWAVDPQEVECLKEELHKANYDLEIICRDMVTN